MRIKEIFYKNRIYKISMDELKHINGYDVPNFQTKFMYIMTI